MKKNTHFIIKAAFAFVSFCIFGVAGANALISNSVFLGVFYVITAVLMLFGSVRWSLRLLKQKESKDDNGR